MGGWWGPSSGSHALGNAVVLWMGMDDAFCGVRMHYGGLSIDLN
jgi:hypothetical protein